MSPRAACGSRYPTVVGAFRAHILQRAFEPYVTTKPRGTGLGLAVVKKIADEHGARIELVKSDRRWRSAGGPSVVIIRP